MYLIYKLFEQIQLRLKEKANSKIDVQFFNGTLKEFKAQQGTGQFFVYVDFPDLTYSSSGQSYGGQQVAIELNLLVHIRDQEIPLNHLKTLDQIVRCLHAWKPEGEFTPLTRVSAGIDERFESPRVYRIQFKLTGTDRSSEAFEWSQIQLDEESTQSIEIEAEVGQSLE